MSDDRGFSLIEVLVALFILATISVAGTSIILRSVQSREALTETSAHVQEFASLHARIRDDLMQWVPRGAESRPTLDPNTYFIGGGVGDAGLLFAFVRDGRANPLQNEARSGLFAVRYVFEGGSLIRQVRPYADPLYDADFSDEVLMTGLDDAYAEFRQGVQWIPQWRATEDTSLTAPVVVKLNLQLENGEILSWLFLTPTGALT